MIALLPEEMIIKSNDDLIMDFKVNNELPVNVFYIPFNNEKSQETEHTVFLQGKYFIVTATVDNYRQKELSFQIGLDPITIISDIQNKFAEMAKIRWEFEHKKKI